VPTMREVWIAIENAWKPLPLTLDAVLYRAAAGSGADLPYRDFLADPSFGWGRVLGDGLELIDVPGGHFSLLREPYVEHLAADLAPRIAAVAASTAAARGSSG
jgi:thioesterase domain-containing protein